MPPFWRTKTLEQLSPAEWEALCDGCGRCCLNKLEDEETGELFFTSISCDLLCPQSGRCTDYRNRQARVPECVQLTPAEVRAIDWLPPTCGYRRVAEGRDLPDWHPLKTGDPDSVHRAGMSVRGRITAREAEVDLDDFEDHLADWPAADTPEPLPAGRAGRPRTA